MWACQGSSFNVILNKDSDLNLLRYGHLEVVEQLIAAPGINMDQLNQVRSDQICY